MSYKKLGAWIAKTAAAALLVSFLSIWTTGYIVTSCIEVVLKQFHVPVQVQPMTMTSVWGMLRGGDNPFGASTTALAPEQQQPPIAGGAGTDGNPLDTNPLDPPDGNSPETNRTGNSDGSTPNASVENDGASDSMGNSGESGIDGSGSNIGIDNNTGTDSNTGTGSNMGEKHNKI